jgi:uncharacterized RDD family membrane protein YckC
MSEPNYGGFWRRCLASLLDNLVWVLFYLWFYVRIVGGAFLAGDTAGIVALLVKQRLGDLAAKTVVVRRAPRAATSKRVRSTTKRVALKRALAHR